MYPEVGHEQLRANRTGKSKDPRKHERRVTLEANHVERRSVRRHGETTARGWSPLHVIATHVHAKVSQPRRQGEHVRASSERSISVRLERSAFAGDVQGGEAPEVAVRRSVERAGDSIYVVASLS